jgi:hypothetical protein
LPRCNGPIEDSDHVMLCLAPSALEQWGTSLDGFQTKLREYHTHPDVERILMAKLRAWPHTDNMHFGELDPTVHLALLSQDQIGWRNLLYGRMSGFWQDAQQEWLVSQQTRWKSSASRWMSKTMRGLWDVCWEMSEHRNHIYHSLTHPWRLAALSAIDVELSQEWQSYVPDLYFPGSCSTTTR